MTTGKWARTLDKLTETLRKHMAVAVRLLHDDRVGGSIGTEAADTDVRLLPGSRPADAAPSEGMMVTYEVLGCTNQEAFDRCEFLEIEDGIRSRINARRLGKATLKDFPIVKIQSSNQEYIEVLIRPVEVPIDMLLWCPACHTQHVDEPDERTAAWDNPPHRSHLCHACGAIWRPADVPTNGVRAIKTRGKADTWPDRDEVSRIERAIRDAQAPADP